MLSHYLCVTVFGSFRQRYVCYDSFVLLLDFWVEALKKKSGWGKTFNFKERKYTDYNEDSTFSQKHHLVANLDT